MGDRRSPAEAVTQAAGSLPCVNLRSCWLLIGITLVTLGLACPVTAAVTPQAAERFTHLLGVSLAKGIDFAELAKRFGPSPVIKTDDAETPDARVCYRTADGKDTVEFFYGTINYGFTLRDGERRDDHCPVSNALRAGTLKAAELGLGMQRTALEMLLGTAVSTGPDRLTYQFQYVHTLTDQEVAAALAEARKQGYDSDKAEDLRNWDVMIYINALFKQGHLSSLTVNRVETN